MIDVSKFISVLKNASVDFFCGVPDSLLKSFCAYITDNCFDNHVITANEGGAVALAAGHYLATGRPALVYMQNSGQGNAVNPLASLADPDVYSIPMVILVGWRGEPGGKDEPQHVKQGRITVELMKTMGIPTYIIPDEMEVTSGEKVQSSEFRVQRSGPGIQEHGRIYWENVITEAVEQAKRELRPVALIVRKGLFAPYELQKKEPDISVLKREDAIQVILELLGDEAVVVSTTGMISREVYETRERLGQDHSHDFLTVGSMGHALMIALGVAKEIASRDKDRFVVCLDGDGASIMQMGNMAIAGRACLPNLVHIVLNNSAHDSVGGQPTVGGKIDLCKIAESCGYYVAGKVEGGTVEELKKLLKERFDQAIYSWACDPEKDHQSTFFEIKVAKGARSDLGRPKEKPQSNKELFMKTLGVNWK